MKLLDAEYFTLRELTRSATAKRLGIDNTPNDEVIANLQKLCTNVLDPLRKQYRQPIRVSSGYRCPDLNKAVGGAPFSAHMMGLAADITCMDDDWLGNRRLQKELLTLMQGAGLPVDKVIIEHPKNNCPDWIHVQWSMHPRRLVYTYDGSSYKLLTESEWKRRWSI